MTMFRVLHTISSMGITHGGPITCLYNLVKGLNRENISTDILTFSPPAGDKISTETFINYLDPPRNIRFGYSKGFSNWLQSNQSYNIYHANAIWQYSTIATAKFARKYGYPYIISTHGMLYPSALNKSKLLKKLALNFLIKNDLDKAAVIHATSMQELHFIKKLGIKAPIAYIPNSIEVNTAKLQFDDNSNFKVGFVGRFDPIKNIELLIKAFALVEAKYSNIELLLIGDGSEGYKNKLLDLSKKMGVKHLKLSGFLTNTELQMAIRSLSVLVLPSKSENFGMVVPEALLQGVPVIASKGTPWEELEKYNCGYWVDFGTEPIKEALLKILLLSKAQRQLMGRNGRDLVIKKYSSVAVSKQMIQLYSWLLKRETKPEFVYD